MKALKLIAVCAFAGLLGACSTPPSDIEAQPRVTAKQAPAEIETAPLPSYRVNTINVVVPKSLQVSERNGYYPGADIVWREDPIGDRHAQVKAIFDNAFARGAKDVRGTQAVNVDVEVLRFHALTEKARYTIGGVHAITFMMQLRDPATGAPVTEAKRVRADLDALGGLAAIRAENQGITQKVRISAHLAQVLQEELSQRGGHQNAQLGVIQAINNL